MQRGMMSGSETHVSQGGITDEIVRKRLKVERQRKAKMAREEEKAIAAAKPPAKQVSDMWRELTLRMDFITPLCGGVPRADELVRPWLENRQPSARDLARLRMEANERGIELRSVTAVAEERAATNDALPDDMEEELAKSWIGFLKVDGKLCIWPGSIRAHMKECAEVLGPDFKAGAYPGGEVRNFKKKFVDAVYLPGEHVFILGRNGEPVTEPTGSRDAAVHVPFGPRGPRNCLKRVDFVTPATLIATIQLRAAGPITRDYLVLCLEYGAVHGFNQDRSLGYGKYRYELSE